MSKKPVSTHVDWHKAIFCAVQIDLKDYAHLLEYEREYTLSANNNHMDMLIIKKQTEFQIPKHIATIFKTHNIFEIKGFNSTLSKHAYYKTNGHAGYYINTFPVKDAPDRHDITLTFPTLHYPRKLFKYLTKECNKTIENPFPGVYYIINEMYATQILVINELSPEDSLFLHCLTKKLNNQLLIENLAKDYLSNKNNELYVNYMNQFFKSHKKGEQPMVCEGLLNYFETSSEELLEQGAERAKKFYEPQIESLTERITHLEKLLSQNNIAY